MRRCALSLSLLLAACPKSSSTPDGGSADAGADAGLADGGRDAGSDAGVDAGFDAGPDVGASVLEHHGSGTRAGFYIDPAFTKAAVAQLQAAPGFSASLTGPMLSQLLYVDNGTTGPDELIAVTEQDTVYAFNPQTGGQLWQQTLGTPVPNSMFAPCGSIDPLGITGTPVIDYGSHTLFFDAMTLQNGQPRHIVYALSTLDGSKSWQLDVNGQIAGFDSSVENQRGALTIAGGVLYVPYGGLAGACGDYHGWVIAVPLGAPTSATGWHTAGTGAGIWGPSGVASDGTSIFVSTAENVPPFAADWTLDDSEAILRVTGAAFSGTPADYFIPNDWYALQASYSQLGSSGVLLFDMPGSTPAHLAFAIGKTSNAYLVNRDDLGGQSDGVAFLPAVAATWVEGALAAYATPQGSYVAMAAPVNACSNAADFSVIKIAAGSPPTMSLAWCGLQGGDGAPIATASAPGKDVVVWGLGGSASGQLTAFDGDTGAVLAENGQMLDLSHWISPIVAKGRLYVGGNSNIYAFSLDGPAGPAIDAGSLLNGDAGPPSYCLPPVADDQPDPCAPYGLACVNPNPATSIYGNCAAPGFGQQCLAGVACASPLSCLPRAGYGNECALACQTDAQCAGSFAWCVDAGASGACTQLGCGDAGFYQPCTVTGPGSCLPTYRQDGNVTGACMPSGVVDAGACNTDAGLQGLCAVGSFCLPGGTTAACVPVCDYATSQGFGDGGPGCPAGQQCISAGGLLAWGVCITPCTSACPAPFTCQGGGCLPP